jgi:hypothetical protein
MDRLRNFLPLKVHFAFLLLVFTSFSFSLWVLLLGSISLYSLLIYLSHNASLDSAPGHVLYSPCFGKVYSVTPGVNHKKFGNDLTEIRVNLPLWMPIGLYLPTDCEILGIDTLEGKRVGLNFSGDIGPIRRTELKLNHRSSESIIGMVLAPRPLGCLPQLNVLIGDRGQPTGLIGYMPLGGSVILYAAKELQLTIKEGDYVSPLKEWNE